MIALSNYGYSLLHLMSFIASLIALIEYLLQSTIQLVYITEDFLTSFLLFTLNWIHWKGYCESVRQAIHLFLDCKAFDFIEFSSNWSYISQLHVLYTVRRS